MSQSLTERYDDRIAGMLSCYDRLVITGTLPMVCYAAGMTGYLNAKGIRIFDYPEFAKTLRDRVRDRAASLAAEAGVTGQSSRVIAHGMAGSLPSAVTGWRPSCRRRAACNACHRAALSCGNSLGLSARLSRRSEGTRHRGLS